MEERFTLSPPAAPEEANDVTTIRDIMQVLFRQRWKFLVAGALTFLLALLWTFGTAKRYTSEMVLLVQNARGKDVITPGQTTAFSPSDVTEEQLNSEIAVLNSVDLVDEMVDPGWTKRAPGSISHRELLLHESEVQRIKAHLDVSAIRSSHVITVKMTSANPEEGRDRLTKLLGAFLAKQSQLGRPPGSSKFFADQADNYKKQISDARTELAKYQQKHGFVSLDTYETTLAQKLADLRGQIRDSDVQISDTDHRISADTAALATIHPRIPTVERAAPAAGTIDQLNTLLVSLTNRRTELLTIYQPGDRLVKQIDQQIADTNAGIKRAGSLGPHEVSSDVNPLWSSTQLDLTSNQTKVQGLRAVRFELKSQADSMQKDLNTSESLSSEFNALQQKVTELESGYRLILEKRDASTMGDLMDRQQWMNVAVIESPTLSLSPSHPKPFQDLLLGGLSSLLVGFLVMFLFETLRDTVATPSELEKTSSYPVLAVVPLNLGVLSRPAKRYSYAMSHPET